MLFISDKDRQIIVGALSSKTSLEQEFAKKIHSVSVGSKGELVIGDPPLPISGDCGYVEYLQQEYIHQLLKGQN